jgi:hypothetical protein
MKNIDVFAETQGLTEELVKQVAEDKIAEAEEERSPEMLLKELFESAPRKVKRKIAPDRKFAHKFFEKMRHKRKESK